MSSHVSSLAICSCVRMDRKLLCSFVIVGGACNSGLQPKVILLGHFVGRLSLARQRVPREGCLVFTWITQVWLWTLWKPRRREVWGPSAFSTWASTLAPWALSCAWLWHYLPASHSQSKRCLLLFAVNKFHCSAHIGVGIWGSSYS